MCQSNILSSALTHSVRVLREHKSVEMIFTKLNFCFAQHWRSTLFHLTTPPLRVKTRVRAASLQHIAKDSATRTKYLRWWKIIYTATKNRQLSNLPINSVANIDAYFPCKSQRFAYFAFPCCFFWIPILCKYFPTFFSFLESVRGKGTFTQQQRLR